MIENIGNFIFNALIGALIGVFAGGCIYFKDKSK